VSMEEIVSLLSMKFYNATTLLHDLHKCLDLRSHADRQ
jgi:hypothetical protein